MKNQKPVTSNKKEKDATYDHVIKYTGVFGGVQGLTMLISILRNKLAAWILGPSGFGLISIFNSIVTFISSLSNLGISFSAVRHVSELFEKGNKEDIRSFVKVIRTWSIWIAIAGIILCLLLSSVISYFSFDGDWSYAGQICILSPMVGCLAITGGEISILKGLRRLKKIAIISVFGAVSTFLCTIPLFYLLENTGIALALLFSTLSVMCIHLYFSLKVFKWEVSPLSSECFYQGVSLIKIGIPYILAAVAGSAAALIIPSFLHKQGSLVEVGLYRAGYAMMVTYAGIVFVAVEADYFPRLSSVNMDCLRMNKVVNQQIDVCVLLMAPFLIFFMLVMPYAVRLLQTAAFLPVVDMAVCSALYMFFKAIVLPIAYIPLAKGDSITYLFVEVIYDSILVLLVIGGYYNWGLTGAGTALSLAGLFDLIMIVFVYSKRYKFRFNSFSIRLSLAQFFLVATGLMACLHTDLYFKYTIGGGALLLSLGISISLLRKKTQLLSAIRSKIKKKIKRNV